MKTIKEKDIGLSVISVGNISAGGTGKTPLVIDILERQCKQKKSVLVTRGYGRKTKGIYKAQPGSTSIELGDEAYLIYLRFNGLIDVVCGSDRYLAASSAKKAGAELIVLDDGYQSIELKRDLNIVLIDATAPVKDYRLLPLGFLREPLSSLNRADVVIITRCHMAEQEQVIKIENVIKRYNASAKILHSEEKSLGVFSGTDFRENSLSSKNAICISAIANAKAFYHMLEDSGINIMEKLERPDHHRWTELELLNIINKAARVELVLITTEKDIVKMPEKYRNSMYYIKIAHCVREEKAWEGIINAV